MVEEATEASTPFASAVDVDADDPSSADPLEADAEYPTAGRPWWRRLKAPSRQLRMGALIAAIAAGFGWTAGAKPWASHRTANKIAAAKSGPAARSAAAHNPQATRANRRVAVNTKSKPVTVAATPPKASVKATSSPKPATKSAQRPAAKPAASKTANKTASKTASKATSKTATPVKAGVAAKAKSVSPQAAKPKVTSQ